MADQHQHIQNLILYAEEDPYVLDKINLTELQLRE